MPERRNEGRMDNGSRLRAQRITDYAARLRELTEAFNLPDDVRRWATVRFDPDAEDETQRARVTVSAQAGRTVATVDVDVPAAVREALEKLIERNRDDLDARLKGDLATNLMAGMTAIPGREE
jgi:hypothetical protein